MSAMPNNIVQFALPKRPRVLEKEAPPDQRKVCVVPFRAVADKQLTDGGLRALAAICSYCNRAGLTWVSQAKVAQDLGVTRQAITNQLAQLRKLGYVEIVRKGFRGERSNTIRVIFDPTVSAQDAIALTSAQEDNRPPAMQETPDPAGQQRIAQMLAKAFRSPITTKEKTMPKQADTMAVRAVKEANAKAKNRRSIGQRTVSYGEPQHRTPEPVDNSLHRQPIGHSGVSQNTENTVLREGIDKVSLKTIGVLGNLSEVQRAELSDAGLSQDEAESTLETLLAAYAAEGLTPQPERLVAEVISLAQVGRGVA
jgi:DNA-binding transcriptional ArsR family regulator